MKQASLLSKLVAGILLVGQLAYADCDFKTGITKVDNGYLYTPECHKKVGKLVLDIKDREEQITQLNKTIELKDLAIKTHEQRAQLWMDSSLKLEDRVNQMDSMRSTNNWIFFGLGVAATSLSIWGASQLVRK